MVSSTYRIKKNLCSKLSEEECKNSNKYTFTTQTLLIGVALIIIKCIRFQ